MSNVEEILKLERKFWDTMANGQNQESSQLLADQAAMVSGMGALIFSPSEYESMSSESPYSIKEWKMTNEKVFFPTPDVAVVTYLVKQSIEHDGNTQTTDNSESSVWIKSDSSWKCVLHTETPLQANSR